MNYPVFILGLGFMAYLCWPAIYSSAQRVSQAWSSRNAGGSTPGVPVVPLAATVTAEQAQAAELILARYLAKGDKSDPVFKLIVNGITTLAAEQKPNATA